MLQLPCGRDGRAPTCSKPPGRLPTRTTHAKFRVPFMRTAISRYFPVPSPVIGPVPRPVFSPDIFPVLPCYLTNSLCFPFSLLSEPFPAPPFSLLQPCSFSDVGSDLALHRPLLSALLSPCCSISTVASRESSRTHVSLDAPQDSKHPTQSPQHRIMNETGTVVNRNGYGRRGRRNRAPR